MNTTIPLPEANGTAENGTRIDFSAIAEKMPSFLDPREIYADMGEIGKLCRIMRIRALRVSLVDEEKEEASIMSLNLDGSAVGSTRKVTENASDDSHSLGHEILPVEKGIDFSTHHIGLNFGILKKMIEKSGKTLRDISSWIEFLDTQLKHELLKIAWKKHSFDPKRFLGEVFSPFLIPIVMLIVPHENTIDKVSAIIMAFIVFFLFYLLPFWPTYFVFYVVWKLLIEQQLMPTYLKKMGERENIPIKFDPSTSLTVGQFEWDRLSEVLAVLFRKKLFVPRPPEQDSSAPLIDSHE